MAACICSILSALARPSRASQFPSVTAVARVYKLTESRQWGTIRALTIASAASATTPATKVARRPIRSRPRTCSAPQATAIATPISGKYM